MKKISLTLFALLGIMLLTGCSKSDDNSSGGAEGDWAGWGTGSYSSLRKDVNMSDMETLVEYAAKVENLKLQTIKLFSKNWEGELFCGDMSDADPDKVLTLLTELLDNQQRYEQAFSQLEASGVLTSVTTRGPLTKAIDFVNYLSGVAESDEQLIKEALLLSFQDGNKTTKIMGNRQYMDDLFNSLDPEYRKGCSTSQEWFTKFNNGEFTTIAPRIKNCWCTDAQGDETKRGPEHFLNNITTLVPDHPIWGTAARVAKVAAQKGMDVTLSTLDKLTGGNFSKAQDAIAVLEEKMKPERKENWTGTRKGILNPASLSYEERNELIRKNPAYGRIICRCESVTEGEILDAIRRPLGARSLDGVKRRTRAGMGRCQAGFCSPRTMEILHQELGLPYEKITKSGGNSRLVIGRTKEHSGEEE